MRKPRHSVVCDEVTKVFRSRHGNVDVHAVRDISLTIEAGETIAIMGANGAGKSTLLSMIAGVVVPTSGKITRTKKSAAVIGLGPGFHEDLTGFENLYLYGALLGVSRSDLRRRRDDIVEFSGLGANIGRPLGHYSTGMRARLAVAIALHADVDLLVIDEVLSVGDLEFGDRSLQRLRELNRSGVTLVMASHDAYSLNLLCQRGILLERGAVAFDGAFDQMVDAYLGSVAMSQGDGSIEVAVEIDDHRIAVGDPLRYRATVHNRVGAAVSAVVFEIGHMIPDSETGQRMFRSTVSSALDIDLSFGGIHEWVGSVNTEFFPGGSLAVQLTVVDDDLQPHRSDLIHLQFESEHAGFRLHIPSAVEVRR